MSYTIRGYAIRSMRKQARIKNFIMAKVNLKTIFCYKNHKGFYPLI